MATVLDEFVVALGLDSSKFVKGSREANDAFKRSRDEAQKTGREFEDRAGSFVGSVSKMRNELLGFLTVFTAGLGVKDFVQNIVGAGVAINRFATLTDMSAQDLGAWRNVAERFGGTADGITSTLYNLTREMQNFTLTGQSQLAPWLRALGISYTDAAGHLKNGNQVLWDLAGNNYLHRMNPARAGAIMANMGLSPSDITLVLQGRAALRAMWEDARKYAPSPADNAAAKALNQQLETLKQESTAVGRSLFTLLFPAIKAVTGGLRAFFELLLAYKPLAVAAFSAIALAVTGLTVAMGQLVLGGLFGGVATGLKTLIFLVPRVLLFLAVLTDTALPALSAAFLTAGAAIEATPIGWVITGLAALTVAGYELIKHWDDIKRFWLHIWDDMRAAVGLPKLYSGDSQAPTLSTAPGGYSLYRGRQAASAAPSSLLGLVRSLEGSGDSAVSPAGAIGRYQVMPGTARQYGFDPSRLTDPDYNTQAATAILSDLMARYRGNISDVLVAYNAGPGRADRFIAGGRNTANLPLETQRYLAHAGRLGYGAGLPLIPSTPQIAVSTTHHHAVRTSSVQVHVGTLAVNAPQARDAHGIARGIVPALERHIYASQANSGLA